MIDNDTEFWWCDYCKIVVPDNEVNVNHVFTFAESGTGPIIEMCTHKAKNIKCDDVLEPYCYECENTGWVQVHSNRPPAFGECQKCYNPMGRRSP